MRRREFITVIGAAAAWPLAGHAQQSERVRRIGVLMSQSADDPNALAWISAFAQGLQERGWTIGGNVRIEYRWGAGDLDRFRKYAAELVALSPDVIVATAGSIVGALQQVSRTVPMGKLWRNCWWSPSPRMNSVLPPPTSTMSSGWPAKTGSEVTPRKAQSASCSPEMIATGNPEAVWMAAINSS